MMMMMTGGGSLESFEDDAGGEARGQKSKIRAFSATPPLSPSTGNCSEAVVHKVAKCNWWR
ncbi:hypothetical protein TYRP_020557 [Tyrophagus putrescentiae]|nr:hypothetical protein TYRP_020557 [Tyrophagus putrescentiae]